MVIHTKARVLFDKADKKFSEAIVSFHAGEMTQGKFEKHQKDFGKAHNAWMKSQA